MLGDIRECTVLLVNPGNKIKFDGNRDLTDSGDSWVHKKIIIIVPPINPTGLCVG